MDTLVALCTISGSHDDRSSGTMLRSHVNLQGGRGGEKQRVQHLVVMLTFGDIQYQAQHMGRW